MYDLILRGEEDWFVLMKGTIEQCMDYAINFGKWNEQKSSDVLLICDTETKQYNYLEHFDEYFVRLRADQ